MIRHATNAGDGGTILAGQNSVFGGTKETLKSKEGEWFDSHGLQS